MSRESEFTIHMVSFLKPNKAYVEGEIFSHRAEWSTALKV